MTPTRPYRLSGRGGTWVPPPDCLPGVGEAVADPRHGQDQGRPRGFRLDLLPQVADVDVDDASLDLDRWLVGPHALEDGLAGQRPAGVEGQQRQQVELRVGQGHLTPTSGHPALVDV